MGMEERRNEKLKTTIKVKGGETCGKQRRNAVECD